jgi:uncharacterized protein involved in exopolysaccharide biosynthesis
MQAADQANERSDFIKYYFIFKRRWIPAGAVAIAIFSLMAIGILSKPNIYQAKGQLGTGSAAWEAESLFCKGCKDLC